MNPGKLNHRVKITYVPSIDDGQGGKTQKGQTETELCSVWAMFEKPRTSTEVYQGGPASIVTQNVVIRRRDDVRAGYKLIDGAKTYRITNVYDVDTESTGLMVQEVSRRAS